MVLWPFLITQSTTLLFAFFSSTNSFAPKRILRNIHQDHFLSPGVSKPSTSLPARNDPKENSPHHLSDHNTERPVDSSIPAYPQQTPHSGRHFYPSHPYYSQQKKLKLSRLNPLRRRKKCRRFTEGWYHRVTIPETKQSFVFIFSIEDPGSPSNTRQQSDLTLCCMQVLGPGDTYLVQSDDDDTKFWAWKHRQGFGCVFEWNENDDQNGDEGRRMMTAMTREEFDRRVRCGFQVLPDSIQGKLIGHDGTLGGVRDGQGIPGNCTFDLTINNVLCGWGGGKYQEEQRSLAGWLSHYPVFEPHWQVTLADARVSGTVSWNTTSSILVDNAPFYSEKNWGGAFPTKWYWVQCNAFENNTLGQLSVTAGGGIRTLPLMNGKTEQLGMIGVHFNGVFYECVPWTGSTSWEVDPWGRWELCGKCLDTTNTHSGHQQGGCSGPFEVELKVKCDPETTPGVKIRAPTKDEGMVYFARDTFDAELTLSLWKLRRSGNYGDVEKFVRVEPPIIDHAFSAGGGAEVGGGPWWDTWKDESSMVQPMKGLVRLPYLAQRIKSSIKSRWTRARAGELAE